MNRSSSTPRGSPKRTKVKGELSVKMPLLPNYLQVSADEKNWLTMSVKEIHPKVLRRVGRAWVEMLVAKSRVKP